MVKKRLPQPSPGELELLKTIWELGPSTVKQIHTKVSQGRKSPKTLTTTLKLIQIMEQKGLVQREGKERPYLFHAMVSEQETQQSLLKDILVRGFHGSAKSLMLCALESTGISGEELGEIRALLMAHKNGEEEHV